MRCPRCSSPVGPEQDWCLVCGAPARTRLAPTPNWQLPTAAIATIVAIAGALLAFAFVKLTSDDDLPAGTTPTAVVETVPPAITAPPVVVPTTPVATTTAPVQPTVPSTVVPGQTTPTTTPDAVTTPAPPTTTPTPPPATTTPSTDSGEVPRVVPRVTTTP